jgi:acetyl-CoA acetyltransferase
VTAFLYDAVRTPFGRFGGGLAGVRPDDLAASALAALADRTPGLVPDEVVLGNANGAGEDNRNVGRMAALLAGYPVTVPGTTVNRLCGSGLDAAMIASRTIESGDAAVVVAGGVESMTRAPWVLPKPDRAFPARDITGVSTTLGWRRSPLARIAGRGSSALEPHRFGYAPVEAAHQALRRAGITWSEVGAVELNEAFAVQSLACPDAWKVDEEIVNTRGGAIALGHPLGASGGRILGTLAKVLRDGGHHWGVAAICIGVGQGLAVVLENVA